MPARHSVRKTCARNICQNHCSLPGEAKRRNEQEHGHLPTMQHRSYSTAYGTPASATARAICNDDGSRAFAACTGRPTPLQASQGFCIACQKPPPPSQQPSCDSAQSSLSGLQCSPARSKTIRTQHHTATTRCERARLSSSWMPSSMTSE